jgi:hypothetical protein
MFGFWKQHGFEILFALSIAILIIIFIINLMGFSKGSYTDYTNYIWDLFNKPIGVTTFNKSPVNTPSRTYKKSFESKGELECRRVAEKLFGRDFSKKRPAFLRNEITGGHNLELDCYNPELKLAIEYNGAQHYSFIPYFHKTRDAFYNIKYRDDMKKRLCEQEGVDLIIVPYTVPLNKIEFYLLNQLNKYLIPQNG